MSGPDLEDDSPRKQIVINRMKLNYFISKTGTVTNEAGAALKPYLNKDGYLAITLTYKGSKLKVKIHRAVAKAFKRNRGGKPFVNHKDGNKLNNDVKNLEWATISENTKHAYKAGLSSYTEPKAGMFTMVPLVALSSPSTPVGYWFPSTVSASRNGFCQRSIRRVINGEQHHHKNFKWERGDELNSEDAG